MISRLDCFDTTPGATGPCAVLAPPADIADGQQYKVWLRDALNDPYKAQVLYITARVYAGKALQAKPSLTGPFSAELNSALQDLARWIYTSPKAKRSMDGPPAITQQTNRQAPLDMGVQSSFL